MRTALKLHCCNSLFLGDGPIKMAGDICVASQPLDDFVMQYLEILDQQSAIELQAIQQGDLEENGHFCETDEEVWG